MLGTYTKDGTLIVDKVDVCPCSYTLVIPNSTKTVQLYGTLRAPGFNLLQADRSPRVFVRRGDGKEFRVVIHSVSVPTESATFTCGMDGYLD